MLRALCLVDHHAPVAKHFREDEAVNRQVINDEQTLAAQLFHAFTAQFRQAAPFAGEYAQQSYHGHGLGQAVVGTPGIDGIGAGFDVTTGEQHNARTWAQLAVFGNQPTHVALGIRELAVEQNDRGVAMVEGVIEGNVIAHLGAQAHALQGAGNGFAREWVVVNDAYGLADQVFGRGPGHGVARLDADRGFKKEGGALPRRAFQADLAAHELNQPLGNHQTQTGATITAGGRGIGLLKGGEQTRGLFGTKPDTGVFDVEGKAAGGVGQATGAHAYHHVAAGGEFKGIAAQIDQHLSQAQGITDQPVRHVGIKQVVELQPLLLRATTDEGGHGVEHLVEHKRSVFQFDAVGFDLRQVEDIIDQTEQELAGAADTFEIVALAVVQVGA